MTPPELSEERPLFLPSTTIPDLTQSITRREDRYCEAGGFGDVFRCWYRSGYDSMQEVAVKVFRFSFTVDEEHKRDEGKAARMIRRELGIWSRLNHPNIVPFLGVAYGFGGQGNASLVSLWMPHGTLHAFLEARGNKLVDAHRLRLLLDIANGLQYLHSFPMIHGDLSSNNVLLDRNYNACLTDFGCASLVGEIPEAFAHLQMSTVRPGTLRWAAPEHFSLNEEETQYTVKSDIYSFGNMALLVLSGKYPWSEVRVDAAVMLRLSQGLKPGRPAWRPIDDHHWELIEWCWSSIPERPAAEDLVSSLQQLLGAYLPPLPLRDLLDVPAPLLRLFSACSSPTPNRDVQSALPQYRLSAQLPPSVNVRRPDMDCGLPSSVADEVHPFPVHGQRAMEGAKDKMSTSANREGSKVPAIALEARTFKRSRVTSYDEQTEAGPSHTNPPVPSKRPRFTFSEEKLAAGKRVTDAPSDRPLPPSKWVRGMLMGRGTYGRVYLALNTSTGQMMAVKHVEKGNKEGQYLEFVAELKKEQEILCGLDHPHVVAYLGSEETTTHLSISLEYIPGGSIATRLREYGRFNEKVVKSFTAQIFDGLAYLHANNITHGDIEVNNILVGESGICKISGFGNARRASDDHAPWAPIRGPWNAPELTGTQSRDCNGPKVDIWSAGCVWFKMGLGGRCWKGGDVVALMLRVQRNVALPAVADFMSRCLAIDPEARTSAAELVRHPYLTLAPDWVFTGFK